MIIVVVDDDTYYWVYLSPEHPFQIYYKVQQVLLQSAIAYFIQYKVRQLFYYKLRQVLL